MTRLEKQFKNLAGVEKKKWQQRTEFSELDSLRKFWRKQNRISINTTEFECIDTKKN